MAEGLKINLGTLEEVAKRCEEDGQVSEIADYAQQKVNKIQRKVLLMRGKTHKQFHELLSDLDDELKDLKNNIEEVSEDITKYIDKMNDATPIDFENEIFIAADFDTFKDKINNIKEKTRTYTNGLVNTQLSEPIPTASLDEILDTENDTLEKRREIYDSYKEGITSLLELNNCYDYIQEVKGNTKKILDLYDQDFDMSDHMRDMVPHAVKAVVVAAITSEVAAAIVGVEGLIAFSIISRKTQKIVVEAGLTSLISFGKTSITEVSNGDTVLGAIDKGADDAKATFGTELLFASALNRISNPSSEGGEVYEFGDALNESTEPIQIAINLTSEKPKEKIEEPLSVKFDELDDGGFDYTYTYYEEGEIHVDSYKIYLDNNGKLHNELELST